MIILNIVIMAILAFGFPDSSYTTEYAMYLRANEYLEKIHNITGPIYRLDIENIDTEKSIFLSLSFLNSIHLRKVFIYERKFGCKYPLYQPINADFRDMINGELKHFIYGFGNLSECSYYDIDICHDYNGRVVLVRYGKQESLFEYDSFDRLVSIKLYDSTYSERELSQEQYIEYNHYNDISQFSFKSVFSGGWLRYKFDYLGYDYHNNWTHRICTSNQVNFRSETWRSIVYEDDTAKISKFLREENPPKPSIDDLPPEIDNEIFFPLFKFKAFIKRRQRHYPSRTHKLEHYL